MIKKSVLESELRDIPKWIKRAIKEGNLDEAIQLKHQMETLEWVLSDDH